MNILKFLQDNRIEYTTNHKHNTQGWVNIHCPFCPPSASKDYHLGIAVEGKGVVNCWRCGARSINALFKILDVEPEELTLDISIGTKPKKIPSVPPLTKLSHTHKKYLHKRGFPLEIIEQRKLKASRFRLFIPIRDEDYKILGYVARDVTDKAKEPYKNYGDIKKYLYGIELIKNSSIIVVEGIFDSWKIPGSVATLGITWTQAQANLLIRFKKVSILFDNEDQAQSQAEKLADHVSYFTETEIIRIPDMSDPGDLDREEGIKLSKKILI